MEAIDNLNKNTDLRNNMISYIVNSKSTSKMSDKQYDALENKLLQKSFAQLKKEYDTLKAKNQMKNGGGIDINELNIPVIRTQFEDEEYEFKNGGKVEEVVKGKYYNIYDPGMDTSNDWEYISYTPGYHTFREEAPMGGGTEIKFTDEELKSYLKENLIKNSFKNGGKVTKQKVYVDLFEDYENIPKKVKEIVDEYGENFGGDGSEMDYKDTANMLKDVEAVGYTFSYGLDNEPFGLRPIGVRLNQLKDYEDLDDDDYANGGATKGFCYTIGGL